MPCTASSSFIRAHPDAQASWRQVLPSSSRTDTAAPLSSNIVAHSAWPQTHATCSSVSPSGPMQSRHSGGSAGSSWAAACASPNVTAADGRGIIGGAGNGCSQAIGHACCTRSDVRAVSCRAAGARQCSGKAQRLRGQRRSNELAVVTHFAAASAASCVITFAASIADEYLETGRSPWKSWNSRPSGVGSCQFACGCSACILTGANSIESSVSLAWQTIV